MATNIPIDTVVYTALFVDDVTSLLKLFPPRHDRIFAHHSTNSFKPKSLHNLEIGKKEKLKITGQVSDENCFAVLVENKKSERPHAHITISCALNITPKYANTLIEEAITKNKVEVFPQPYFIDTTEGYMDHSGKYITSI